MDYLTFIKGLVDAVCWPLVIVIIVVQLKKPISELIEKLATIKVKMPNGIDISIGREADEIDSKIDPLAKKLNADKKSDKNASKETDGTKTEIEGKTSVDTVQYSWDRINREIKEALLRGGAENIGDSPIKMITQLNEQKRIDSDMSEALIQLYDVRNTVKKVKNAAATTVSGADRYSVVADKAVNVLKLV